MCRAPITHCSIRENLDRTVSVHSYAAVWCLLRPDQRCRQDELVSHRETAGNAFEVWQTVIGHADQSHAESSEFKVHVEFDVVKSECHAGHGGYALVHRLLGAENEPHDIDVDGKSESIHARAFCWCPDQTVEVVFERPFPGFCVQADGRESIA